MKNFFNISLAMIMLIGVLTIGAQAQTSSAQKLIANIPFTFTAGKTTLPAGKYTITVLNPASDRKVLQIRRVSGHASAIVLTMSNSSKATDDAKLVFERYGDQYFFAQAQMAGDPITLAAVRPKGRAEKDAMAKANKKSLVVIVME